MATLATLLDYPFQLIRLGAYWNRIEDGPGRFDTGELDRQVDAAEQAGKQIIVCVGPVKTFGYPEFFVPGHHLPEPLREGALVEPAAHSSLLDASTAFAARVVKRYRDRSGGRGVAGRARCRRPARHGALMAPVGRLRAAGGRGGPRGRPDQAGHDERLPADLDAGAGAAVVAHPRPGRFAGRRPAAGRHRRCRLLPAARAGGPRRADGLPGRAASGPCAGGASCCAGPPRADGG